MPNITNIVYNKEKERYWIYVDGEFCTSIRKRTFPALKIKVGDEISCEKVKELENFHWKNVYNVKSWEKEKVRLDKVKKLIEGIDPKLKVNVVGFGADTTEYIKNHPEESGSPDIEVVINKSGVIVVFVEVSGTENMRGDSYWVRHDKIKFIQNHPDKDIWIILHYALPEERFIFIKIRLEKEYKISSEIIKNAEEYYVEFFNGDPEIKLFEEFKSYLLQKIEAY